MKAGQTSVRNGIEDILFPMEVMRITQGDNVGTHKGTFATDLAGKDAGQDLAYFPFSAKSVALDTKNGNAVVWESLKPVRFADGTIDYACVMVIHDNDPSGYEVGKSYKQGQQMAQEGTAGNAYGNHLHVEFAKGKFKRSANGSMYGQNSKGVYHLNNNIPIEKACFMDNTIMKAGVADWKYLKDVKVTENTKPKKTIDDMANEVRAGKHGTGHSNRQKSLGISDKEYAKVRARVNELEGAKTPVNTPKPQLRDGAKVQIKSSAVKYVTDQPIPNRYKGVTYTVIQIKHKTVLIKELMSWVYIKDIVVVG